MVRGAWYDEVIAKKPGRDDRTLRFVAGVALAVVGLFVLAEGGSRSASPHSRGRCCCS